MLLLSVPKNECYAQWGILKGLSKGAKGASKVGKAAKAGTAATKAAKAAKAGTTAAERAKWIKQVSKSQKGIEITERAKRMFANSNMGRRSVARAAQRTTEKMIRKGGLEALENATNREIRQIMTEELAKEELKAMAFNSLSNVFNNRDNSTPLLKNEVVDQQTSTTILEKLPDKSFTHLSPQAIEVAREFLNGNTKELDEFQANTTSRRTLKMLNDHPDLVKSYLQCGKTIIQDDPVWVNYLAYHHSKNRENIDNIPNVNFLSVISRNSNKRLLDIDYANERSIAILYYPSYEMVSSGKQCSYYIFSDKDYIFNLFPLKNCCYIQMSVNNQINDNDLYIDNTGYLPTSTLDKLGSAFYTDKFGRLKEINSSLNKDDIRQYRVTGNVNKELFSMVMYNVLGDETLLDNQKKYQVKCMLPCDLGGKEVRVNIVPISKDAKKMFNKVEKVLHKHLSDKKIMHTLYKISLDYDNAITLCPKSFRIAIKSIHKKKGEKEEVFCFEN